MGQQQAGRDAAQIAGRVPHPRAGLEGAHWTAARAGSHLPLVPGPEVTGLWSITKIGAREPAIPLWGGGRARFRNVTRSVAEFFQSVHMRADIFRARRNK